MGHNVKNSARVSFKYVVSLIPVHKNIVGHDSAVGIATGYGLYESNPDGGDIFHICPDRPRGPPSHLYDGYRGSFPGCKSAGARL
jgi:hypothetical protein